MTKKMMMIEKEEGRSCFFITRGPLMLIAPLGGLWYYSIWKAQMMMIKMIKIRLIKLIPFASVATGVGIKMMSKSVNSPA